MKVLVVGGGGREHALAWKISRSPLVKSVIVAPGNGGTAREHENAPVKAEDVPGIVALAKERRVDFVVVGPEAPLVAGLADRLVEEKIPVFGPSAKAAQLEGSKAFAKAFMKRHAIPTADYAELDDLSKAIDYVRSRKVPQVVKADGLAAGKGVFVCSTNEEAEKAVRAVLSEGVVGSAGARVVIEDRLPGVEVSMLALTDGEAILPLATARDHKRAFDRDEGPNTGGMGAYSPARDVTPEMERRIFETVLRPTVAGMKKDGIPYRGVLYAGLMMDRGEPKVLEFNARFGDPETQPLLFRMSGDIVPALLACAQGGLGKVKLEWDPRAAACVVMVAEAYPGDVRKGDAIEGLDEAAKVADCKVFHAGTALKDGAVVTSGGRVLGVTALGADVRAAAKRAYEAVDRIRWKGARARRDIGANAP